MEEQKASPHLCGQGDATPQSGLSEPQPAQHLSGSFANGDSSQILANQSSAFLALQGSRISVKCDASAAPPPSSEASLMLILGRMGALRLVKHNGSTPQKQSISSMTSGGIDCCWCLDQLSHEMNVKIDSKTEKLGLLKLAAKHATPAQCCMFAWVTKSLARSTRVVAISLKPLIPGMLHPAKAPINFAPKNGALVSLY